MSLELQKPRVEVEPHVTRWDDNNELHNIAWDAAEYFREHQFDKQFNDELGILDADPLAFFSTPSLRSLSARPVGERIVLLAHACSYLDVSPTEIQSYFTAFPNDSYACGCAVSMEPPRGSFEFKFLGTILPYIRKEDFPTPFSLNHGQYTEIAKRRQHSHELLIMNSAEEAASKAVVDPLLRGYSAAFSKADELDRYGEHILDTSQVFTNTEYVRASEGDKARAIRHALARSQWAHAAVEVWNSAFTKEMHEKIASFKSGNNATYDPGHSMIFKTVQSRAAHLLPKQYYENEMSPMYDTGGDPEEYPFHRLTMAVLREFKNRGPGQNNVEILVDFWLKNRNPLFANDVADALSKQGAAHAALILMHALQKDTWNPHSLATILYRLELGQITIDSDGVNYLGRMYDLGEMNRPDFFVRRLTATGEIGVFDDSKTLKKLFKLGDLTQTPTPSTRIRAEMLDVTAEMLFGTDTTGTNGTNDLVHEKLVEDFTKEYFAFYGDDFFKKTGIAFNNLTLREQGWFLHYMHRMANNTDKERAINLATAHGETFLKVFLAVQHDPHIGDTILTFAESCPDKTMVSDVFATLVTLLQQADTTADFLHTHFEIENKEAGDAVRAQIVEIALALVRNAAAANNVDGVRKILSGITKGAHMLLTFSSKQLKTAGVLTNKTIHEMPAFVPIVKTGDQLDTHERAELRAMFKKQYTSRGGGYAMPMRDGEPQTFAEALEKSLTAALESPTTRWYLLKGKEGALHDVGVIAALRFDDRADGIHMASVMTALNKSGIGELHAQAAFEKEKGSGRRIYAECDRASGITQKYLDWGFAATELIEAGHVLAFKIDWLPEREGMQTASSHMSRADIVAKAQAAKNNERLQDGNTCIYLMHGTPDESLNTVETREAQPLRAGGPVPERQFALLHHGYVLTRYFTVGSTNYAAFEKL
jgi:hypothetical protein